MVSCWIYGRWAAPQEYLRHVGPCKSLHLGRVGLSTKLNFVKMARWHSSTRNGCHHSPYSKGALAGHFDCHMIQDFRLKTKLAVTPKDTILERSIKINYMLARWVQQFFFSCLSRKVPGFGTFFLSFCLELGMCRAHLNVDHVNISQWLAASAQALLFPCHGESCRGSWSCGPGPFVIYSLAVTMPDLLQKCAVLPWIQVISCWYLNDVHIRSLQQGSMCFCASNRRLVRGLKFLGWNAVEWGIV